MKLRTKIEVTYNSGIAGSETGIVEGNLQDCAWFNDFNSIGANYTYNAPNGEPFHKNGFTVEGEKIEQLYEAIKASVTEDLGFRDKTRLEFYLAFVFEMSKTFGIATTDIEIVK
jgi:hypothetical protein